ncbi:MAG: circadian clock KaiB family protein [Rhodospirillaceae bacterium]|nr:circadian clock KaiB family protein [Rhodospirillaceae bacterium]
MNAVTSANRRVVLRLFVAGATPSAEKAKTALDTICTDLRAAAPGASIDLQVVDVLADPDLALMDQVFATPTVIRVSPGPSRRLFGDLSSPEMVMIGLQLAPEASIAR